MNKLTLNLLILLTIPCILYGRNFNVMDFGARGNGISDDAIAIQKAVRMPEGEMWSFPPIIHSFQDPYS